jgi:exportin-1
MEELMNDQVPFEGQKIRLLESLVAGLSSSSQTHLNEATAALEALKTQTNFWVHTQAILQNSHDTQTIFFTLTALQEVVSKKWNILDASSRLQVRNFALETMLSWCSLEKPWPHVKLCLQKLNSVIVEIVKQEWRTTWKTALSDLISAAYKNEHVCANNLKILKELSGEIFDYERKNLPSHVIAELKQEFVGEFQSVYRLCSDVSKSYLANPQQVSPELITTCIETLQAFLSWMPPFYVLTTDLIDGILIHLISQKKFLLKVLNCFEQVFKIPITDFEADPVLAESVKVKLVLHFGIFLDVLASLYKLSDSFEVHRQSLLRREYKHLNAFQSTTQGFAVAIFNFFSTHSPWLFPWLLRQQAFLEILRKLRIALSYMASFTEIKDPILFKNCVDFWNFFLKNVYKNLDMPAPLLSLGEPTFADIKKEFSNSVSEMIMIQVLRVPKPQEIRIIIDEQGLPCKEELTESENSMVYEIVRENLRLYALDNFEAVRQIIAFKLDMQVALVEWSYDNLNSICWAAACLADLKGTNDERNLFVNTLKALLTLCASKKSLEDKIVIASNIMHIVSQNSIYLKDIASFLEIVVKKLLEFANEQSEEICEMACNTLLKIAKQLGLQFVRPQSNPKSPASELLIEVVLTAMPRIIEKMSIPRKIDFYEALGCMIAAEPDEQTKVGYLIRASAELERLWMSVFNHISDKDFFTNMNNANSISLFLRIHANFCLATGYSYRLYFDRCFANVDQVYQNYYQLMGEMLGAIGPAALNYAELKKFRGVRKDILVLFQNLILVHKNHPQNFLSNYSGIFDRILQSFISEPSETKEAEVFDVISAALSVLDRESIVGLLSSLPMILQSTLPMITQDFTSFPEVRHAFFGLLKSIANNCFDVFVQLEAENFQTIISCLLWALRHEIMSIHEVGMGAIIAFLTNINRQRDYMEAFYKAFFIKIFNEVLFVATDGLHQNGFSDQAKCLFLLIAVAGQLPFPLLDGTEDNLTQLYGHTAKLMSEEFKNLTLQAHQTELHKLFSAVGAGEKEFKVALKDYLININLFLGNEPTEDNRPPAN